jgi:hypothetical protein
MIMNERIESIYKGRILHMLKYTVAPVTYRTATELARFACVNETMDTCPITRGLIRSMIIDGELIGSTSKGYKLMDSGKEVQQCLNSLLRRQMGISRRIQSIYDAAQAKGIL